MFESYVLMCVLGSGCMLHDKMDKTHTVEQCQRNVSMYVGGFHSQLAQNRHMVRYVKKVYDDDGKSSYGPGMVPFYKIVKWGFRCEEDGKFTPTYKLSDYTEVVMKKRDTGN